MRPWRMYFPGPSWFRYRRLLGQLDAYLTRIIEARWSGEQTVEKPDLLQKRIDSIRVSLLATADIFASEPALLLACLFYRDLWHLS